MQFKIDDDLDCITKTDQFIDEISADLTYEQKEELQGIEREEKRYLDDLYQGSDLQKQRSLSKVSSELDPHSPPSESVFAKPQPNDFI